MSEMPQGMDVFGETPFADQFSNRRNNAMKHFAESMLSTPRQESHHVAVAMDEIFAGAEVALRALESRLNRRDAGL